MQVDLLVFGPHPDDIEIGLGGAVARHVQLGYDLKRRALDCHRSQFRPSSVDAVTTRLTSPRFRQTIEARDSYL